MNPQTSQLNQTASIIRSAKALLVISTFVIAPAIHADCLPTVQPGGSVPFYLSTHNVATHAVGYSAGTLADSGTTFSVLSGNQFPQSFSDRFAPLNCTECFGPSWPGNQNFSIASLDHVGLSITRTLASFGHPSTISITLTFDTWGNTKTTFTGVCDATTNLLYGSYNSSGNTMAVISFGTPEGQNQ
jgi:hypothetical protein